MNPDPEHQTAIMDPELNGVEEMRNWECFRISSFWQNKLYCYSTASKKEVQIDLGFFGWLHRYSIWTLACSNRYIIWRVWVQILGKSFRTSQHKLLLYAAT